ncbi:MAG: hypothetical protein GF398_01175 [Chitinivibrionales bacterium]|nr:hypothetical protein [Chitinivibrionales bacterium]
MKHFPVFAALAFCVFGYSFSVAKGLSGDWCIEKEGLIIHFTGRDSLRVSSSTEEGVSGNGFYKMNDSTLRATVRNEDLIIEMGYNYKWKNDSTLLAKPAFLIINADTVEHTDTWMNMSKCTSAAEDKK